MLYRIRKDDADAPLYYYLFFSPESRTWHVLLQLGFALSLSLSHSLSLSLCQMTHTLESESGFRWFVQSFVRSFALLLLRAEHLRKGGEVQSKVESWVHPVI